MPMAMRSSGWWMSSHSDTCVVRDPIEGSVMRGLRLRRVPVTSAGNPACDRGESAIESARKRGNDVGDRIAYRNVWMPVIGPGYGPGWCARTHAVVRHRNWPRLPDGLTVEFIPATGNCVAQALAIDSRARSGTSE